MAAVVLWSIARMGRLRRYQPHSSQSSVCRPAPPITPGASVPGMRHSEALARRVGENVQIAADCVVAASAVLGRPALKPGDSKPTRLGERAEIGHHAVLFEAVVVGDDTIVEAHTYVRERTTIGSHCVLGPHVGLGFDTTIGDRVRIGAFSW